MLKGIIFQSPRGLLEVCVLIAVNNSVIGMSQSENILPAPAANRTKVAGYTGKHSTTSL